MSIGYASSALRRIGVAGSVLALLTACPSPSRQAAPPHSVVSSETPSPTHLQPSCPDVIADVGRRNNGSGPAEQSTHVDLDGDGQDDWIVVADVAAELSGYFYLTRGGCARWVGEWQGGMPRPLASRTNGVLDLEAPAPCKPGCCPAITIALYRFDGARYQKASERTETRNCPGLDDASFVAGPKCLASSAPPSALAVAAMSSELKTCRQTISGRRLEALRREMQARLRASRLTRQSLTELMGTPDDGEKAGPEIWSVSRGAFDTHSADVLWGYRVPFGCVWFALKGDRVVGSGVFEGPRD